MTINTKLIKDEIRKLNPLDRIAIYRWIGVKIHAAILLSGIEVYRSVANRQGVDQKCRVIS